MRRLAALLTLCASAGVGLPALAQQAPRWELPSSVRACPQYGTGFVQVPGSATCVRIGGRVVAETTVGSRRVSRDDIAGFKTSGRVSIDTRTQTELGPVRTFVRVRAGDRTGRDTQAYVQTP